MSLGFNQLRRPYYTNLPGAVGASVVRRSPTRRTPPTPRPPEMAPLRKEPPMPVVQKPPMPVVQKPPTPVVQKPPMPVVVPDQLAALFEETQCVYATAQVALTDEEGAVAASEGERLVLVYPMRTDAGTGRVRMRLKTVHPTTGALKHTWVGVYDPDADTPHLVTDFSLLP